MPFGLYGDITTRPLVDRLSDGGDNLTFVGTTNGLYVVASGGRLQHFMYSPFGIKHIALIDDITGDGTREVVVALNDTQVPALRCCDGATWEELWRFAPMIRIWDRLWVDRQIIITDLEVTGDGDSQSLLLTSGRCVLSVDAADGVGAVAVHRAVGAVANGDPGGPQREWLGRGARRGRTTDTSSGSDAGTGRKRSGRRSCRSTRT